MMNILVVGNPGAGKSTILNTLLQKAQFKSGASLGVGLTFRFDKFQENGITYMDTPGLCDRVEQMRPTTRPPRYMKVGTFDETMFPSSRAVLGNIVSYKCAPFHV